jgi:hypothetical protein
MSKNNDRLTRLREANQIVKELEDKFDQHGPDRTNRIRSTLETAGRHLTSGTYEKSLQNAMGETAGLAIGQGWYDLADRAIRLVNDDVEPQNGASETVEDEAAAETEG